MFMIYDADRLAYLHRVASFWMQVRPDGRVMSSAGAGGRTTLQVWRLCQRSSVLWGRCQVRYGTGAEFKGKGMTQSLMSSCQVAYWFQCYPVRYGTDLRLQSIVLSLMPSCQVWYWFQCCDVRYRTEFKFYLLSYVLNYLQVRTSHLSTCTIIYVESHAAVHGCSSRAGEL